MIKNAFNSTSPLVLQALKDEACFLYLSNETDYKRLKFDAKTHAKIIRTAQTKFTVEGKKVYFKFSKSKVSKKLKSDLDVKTKLQIAAEGTISDSFIESTTEKVVTKFQYLSLKSLVSTVKSIYDKYAGANAKEIKKQLHEQKINCSNLGDFIQAVICLFKCADEKTMKKGTVAPLQPILTKDIEELVKMDLTFLEKSGNNLKLAKIILVLVDHFSKYIVLKPVYPTRDAKTVKDAIEKAITRLPFKPITLLFDNGGEFKNEKLEEWCKEQGITMKHGLPYSPTTQVCFKPSLYSFFFTTICLCRAWSRGKTQM